MSFEVPREGGLLRGQALSVATGLVAPRCFNMMGLLISRFCAVLLGLLCIASSFSVIKVHQSMSFSEVLWLLHYINGCVRLSLSPLSPFF